MITKEWCKEYALINQGLNADNIFPIAFNISAFYRAYPHMLTADNALISDFGMCATWGTWITVPVTTLPTWDCTNCNVSVVRALRDIGVILTAVPFDVFKTFNPNDNGGAGNDAFFIPAGSVASIPFSYAFLGNFERQLNLFNDNTRKASAYVFPYILAGNLSVSNTAGTDYVSLTNQFHSRMNSVGSSLLSNRYGMNTVHYLTETLDYVPVVFDAIRLQWASSKSCSFVGYAIQKQESSYQSIRTALFTVPVLP